MASNSLKQGATLNIVQLMTIAQEASCVAADVFAVGRARATAVNVSIAA
jgi:hypothetical protein